jgi:Na+/proline symporter
MQLEWIDWVIVGAFFVTTLAIGAMVSRQAGKSTSEFFLSGRNMPWWLLGFSMVATTFAADTPLTVTNMVRVDGVSSNWEWWAMLLTGMLTVFVYAKLWRRSQVVTDLEFYELRYSGRPAAFLRGFRAIYLGVVFNAIVMGNVTLAAIKIGHVMFGLSPLETIAIAALVCTIFSAMGGLRGVLITDCILFIAAMVGSIGAAWYCLGLEQVGGLSNLLANEAVRGKMDMMPEFDFSSASTRNVLMTIFIVPLLVQWWSVFYPGAEPGGGGYVAQRILAAKNEKHATGATLLFTIFHYAVRPWPWILVALASMLVYPDIASLAKAFPDLPENKIHFDLAYPAMLVFLPVGLKGLVVASLIAAYMSTMSTALNWGSSYLVYDFWKRFLQPEASERSLVRIGRISTVLLMAAGCGMALIMESALDNFRILLQIGAGTGLLYILRWYWWRINPYGEMTAMVVSFLVALGMMKFAPESFPEWARLVSGVAITTLAWMAVTLVTPPATDERLYDFYRRIRPGGPGWRRIRMKAESAGVDLGKGSGRSNILVGVVCMIAACLGTYALLFGTGFWLYSQPTNAILCGVVALVSSLVVARLWNAVHREELESQ